MMVYGTWGQWVSELCLKNTKEHSVYETEPVPSVRANSAWD
jgi:hypothetical protein